jgi:hypothetical protein
MYLNPLSGKDRQQKSVEYQVLFLKSKQKHIVVPLQAMGI